MDLTPIKPSPERVLYEQVADQMQKLITSGAFKPGDRLPSVRKLKQQFSVSLSTVLDAYRLLEARGLITARPQSGYYVRQTFFHSLQEPAQSKPLERVSEIDISLAFNLFNKTLDPDVIPLGAAIPSPEHFPVEQLNRVMARMLRNHPIAAHSYNTSQGCPTFRAEIARRMLEAGCSIDPEQVVSTNGTLESIYLSLQAVTQPGDTVAIESPVYFGILETMKVLQLKALSLPTHPREGICLSHLEDALTSGEVKACFLVSSFSNPLGTCMDDVKKKQLVDLLNRYQIPLIEDDVYGELYFSGGRPKAIKAFDTENRVLYCSSMSKTLSPGLRVGWCIGGMYHTRILQLKSVINLTTAAAPQLTVADFLSSGGYDRHLRQLRRMYQFQMARITQAICDYFPADIYLTQPHGGHVVWVELPERLDSLHLYHQALNRRISIAPGPLFSATGKCFRNFFRLSTAVPWSSEVEESIKILGSLIHDQLIANDTKPSS